MPQQPVAQREFPQIFPRAGWVEHDPEAIWESQLACAREVLAAARLRAGDVAAIGLTNQRETTVVWNRETGEPVANALVWQDTRVSEDVAGYAQRFGVEFDVWFSERSLMPSWYNV